MYVLVETDGKYRVYDSFSMKLNTELQFYELESSLEYKLCPQRDILKNKDIHGVPMKIITFINLQEIQPKVPKHSHEFYKL